MEESLINKRIKEMMEKYPSEKPPLIGVYRVEGENITVAYLYEKKEGKLVTNMNDRVYHGFDPVEHVYNILAQGYQPFYLSDVAHYECWKETIRSLDDYDAPFHHGRKLYFEYCRKHKIDSHYMSQISDDIICAADSFATYDKKLSSNVKEKLAQCVTMDSTTLKNYEYLLNEPSFCRLELGFTLKDQYGTISYFPYDYSCMVLIRDAEYPFVRDLYDWGFDFETGLFNALHSGASIQFMSSDIHEDIIAELDAISKTEYDLSTQEGIKKYLKYCKQNNIQIFLSDNSKEILKGLYKNYEVSKSKQNQER